MTLLSMLFNLALSSKHPGSEKYLSVWIELGCLVGLGKKFSHKIRSVDLGNLGDLGDRGYREYFGVL